MHRSPSASQPGHLPGSLVWEIGVGILDQPLVLIDTVKVFGLAFLVVWGLVSFLFAVDGRWQLVLDVGLLLGALSLAVLVIGTLVAALVYRNRLRHRFTLAPDAAICERIDRRARTVGRLTILLGLLLGRPGAVGTGLITETSVRTRVAWSSVRRVTLYPSFGAIRLRNDWRTTLILYCRPEAWDEVVALVEAFRAAHPPRVRPNPVPGVLARTAGIVVASLPLFHLPGRIDAFVPFLVMCFALSAVWLLPVFAWVTLAGLGWFAIVCGVELAPHRLHADDMALIAFALIGAAWLVWLSVGLLRGRITSALVGDENESDGG